MTNQDLEAIELAARRTAQEAAGGSFAWWFRHFADEIARIVRERNQNAEGPK